MKINYLFIKKIHLYACLSTVALLLMFILTSYLMVHHDWFDHERQSETTIVPFSTQPETDADWKRIVQKHQIKGRFTGERTNQDGHLIREYGGAAGWTTIKLISEKNQIEITKNFKSKADAIIGIHRQRGYGSGPLQYNIYAFLLDVMAISLLLFVITGIIMWFKLLKNNWVAWLIFGLGFVYCAITVGLLMYW